MSIVIISEYVPAKQTNSHSGADYKKNNKYPMSAPGIPMTELSYLLNLWQLLSDR